MKPGLGFLNPQTLRSGGRAPGHTATHWQMDGQSLTSLRHKLSGTGKGQGVWGVQASWEVPHPGQVLRAPPQSARLYLEASVPHIGVSKDLRVLAIFGRGGGLMVLG